jgi:hypothetical protein
LIISGEIPLFINKSPEKEGISIFIDIPVKEIAPLVK